MSIIVSIETIKKNINARFVLALIISLSTFGQPLWNAGVVEAKDAAAVQAYNEKCKTKAQKKKPRCKRLAEAAGLASARETALKRYKNECKTAAQKQTKKCKNIAETAGLPTGQLGATPTALKKISAGSAGVSKKAANNNALKNILNGVYQIAGVVAVIVMIVAGIRMITGGDNPDNVATARKMIIYAAAGLVIIISAFVITQFVINAGST